MKRTCRKLDQNDFRDRIGRIDAHHRKIGLIQPGPRRRNEHPIFWTVVGFVWIFFVLMIGKNLEWLQDSLTQGALSERQRDWVLYAVVAIIMVSLVKIGFHALRLVIGRKGHRGASGSLVLGALAAGVLAYAPADLMEQGLQKLGDGSGEVLLAAADEAHAAISVSVSSVTFVSQPAE